MRYGSIWMRWRGCWDERSVGWDRPDPPSPLNKGGTGVGGVQGVLGLLGDLVLRSWIVMIWR